VESRHYPEQASIGGSTEKTEEDLYAPAGAERPPEASASGDDVRECLRVDSARSSASRSYV